MKKNIIYIFLLLILNLCANQAISQNTWDNSTANTSTSGNVGIGTNIDPTIKTSIQTQGDQNLIGLKVVNKSDPSSDLPNISANRYGIYTYIDGASESNYALFAEAKTDRNFAGYFRGTVGIDGRLDLDRGTGNRWTLNLGWQQGNNTFYITPRNADGNFDFSSSLSITREGHMQKTMSKVAKVLLWKAFSVTVDGRDEFLVKANGHIFAREIQVLLADFPDYVFEKDYDLMPIEELKSYIITNKHLPNIPAGKEIDKNGIGLGDLAIKQMEKIEQLTLYIIELNEKLSELENKIEEVENK